MNKELLKTYVLAMDQCFSEITNPNNTIENKAIIIHNYNKFSKKALNLLYDNDIKKQVKEIKKDLQCLNDL